MRPQRRLCGIGCAKGDEGNAAAEGGAVSSEGRCDPAAGCTAQSSISAVVASPTRVDPASRVPRATLWVDKFFLPRHPMHLKDSANLWPAVLPGEGFHPLQDAIYQPSKHAETYAPGELVEFALPAPCSA